MVLAFQIIAGFFISFFFADITERAIFKRSIKKQLKKLTIADQEVHKAITIAELRFRSEREKFYVQECAFEVIKFLTWNKKEYIRDEVAQKFVNYNFIDSAYQEEWQYVKKIHDCAHRYNKRAGNGFCYFAIAINNIRRNEKIVYIPDHIRNLDEHLQRIGFLKTTNEMGNAIYRYSQNVVDDNFLWGRLFISLWLSEDQKSISNAEFQFGFPWEAFSFKAVSKADGGYRWELHINDRYMHAEAEEALSSFRKEDMSIIRGRI